MRDNETPANGRSRRRPETTKFEYRFDGATSYSILTNGRIRLSGSMKFSMDNDVTRILNAIKAGSGEATDQLLPIVYHELRDLAQAKLRNEAAGNTLQPTALVHEAYLRLIGSANDDWENRSHFFGAAAEAMRRILIDHARAKKSQKRGGGDRPVSLDGLTEISLAKADELIALDEALNELTAVDSVKAELVKLRFFVGLNMEESAAALGMSIRTAERNWAFARAWLHREMTRN